MNSTSLSLMCYAIHFQRWVSVNEVCFSQICRHGIDKLLQFNNANVKGHIRFITVCSSSKWKVFLLILFMADKMFLFPLQTVILICKMKLTLLNFFDDSLWVIIWNYLLFFINKKIILGFITFKLQRTYLLVYGSICKP